MLRDQRDRERREARAAAAARGEAELSPPVSPTSSPMPEMPGTGYSLVTQSDVTMDNPAHHEDGNENND